MDLKHLINHPEDMNKETLYELRALIAMYPYYQTARLLMLQNLYLLHDSSFDEELSRSALYITDRKVLFNMIEAAHYEMKKAKNVAADKEGNQAEDNSNRTVELIDDFLSQTPTEEQPAAPKRRKPTTADATIDYVAYLLQLDDNEEESQPAQETTPELRGQELIDNFIFNEGGQIKLHNNDAEPQPAPAIPDEEVDEDEDVLTETMAKIYIKQGQYSKAIEIITQLNLNNPKKNVYFADQLRFLEKLVLNNKSK